MNGIPLTEEMKQNIIKWHNGGITASKMPVNIDPARINKYLKSVGFVTTNGWKLRFQVAKDKIIELNKKGDTVEEIHKKTKLADNYIRKILRLAGLSTNRMPIEKLRETYRKKFTKGEQRIHDRLKAQPLESRDFRKTMFVTKYDVLYGYAPRKF